MSASYGATSASSRKIKVTMREHEGGDKLQRNCCFLFALVVGALAAAFVAHGQRETSLSLEWTETDVVAVKAGNRIHYDDDIADDTTSSSDTENYSFWGFVSECDDSTKVLQVLLKIVGVWPFVLLGLVALAQHPSLRRRKASENFVLLLCHAGKWSLTYIWFISVCATALRLSSSIENVTETKHLEISVTGYFTMQATGKYGTYFIFAGLATLLALGQIMHNLMARERRYLEAVVRNQATHQAAKEEIAQRSDGPGGSFAPGLPGFSQPGAVRAYFVSLALIFTTTILIKGFVLPSYKVVAEIEGTQVMSVSHSIWSGAELLGHDNTFGFDNSGLRVLTLTMVIGLAFTQQVLLLIVWFMPLPSAVRSRLRNVLKIIADWSSFESYLAALYVLRWQLSSMVDAIGGDLVSKYGLTLSLEAEPWAGTAISDPLLLLFIVALVNEVLLHLGVMQQTAEEKQEEALSYDLRAQEHYGESFQQLEP